MPEASALTEVEDVVDTIGDRGGASPPWPAGRGERWSVDRLLNYANNPLLNGKADFVKIVVIPERGEALVAAANEQQAFLSFLR